MTAPADLSPFSTCRVFAGRPTVMLCRHHGPDSLNVKTRPEKTPIRVGMQSLKGLLGQNAKSLVGIGRCFEVSTDMFGICKGVAK